MKKIRIIKVVLYEIAFTKKRLHTIIDYIKINGRFFIKKGLLISLLGIGLLGTTSYAATWTISTLDVPNWGGNKVSSEANVKASNDVYASFNGDVTPNSFGYYADLVNSNKEKRCADVSLKKNTTTRASDNTLKKGYYGYARVQSKSYEPSNSRVKLHFSSDKK